ncbi:hypothetical protein NNX28_06920 [Arthrobacter sp. zg-Y859]|uniref:Uncharacterized protein n=1 Tax=Arthrobacter jinronghuae TaxID=2964609 RepID=A0ABT1NSX3_9MICC|nr:hypothetical protein [Arthrobacter jinronghuae]MCQ1949661.1 hypothetical protein [Arthrobacter jinronghuae]UWX77577.1 hypothetical protein N2K98_11340 [Arthrobacter jinronghuae]
MSQSPGEQPTPPRERPWTTAALLLVGIGSYAAVFLNTQFIWPLDDEGAIVLVNRMVFALVVVLTGLMVFAPARPPAAGIRLTVYLAPLGLLLWLVPAQTGSMELVAALLPPWALLTALYGVPGGLPKGWKFVLVCLGTGAAGYLLIATVWFNELVWVMPLLPLGLLLLRRYRECRLRMAVEIFLAVLLAACIGAEFVILPQGDSWVPYRSLVGTACTISLFYTLVLLGLARRTGAEATSPAKTG